jgi:8-oxo-dGTP diphosphatase
VIFVNSIKNSAKAIIIKDGKLLAIKKIKHGSKCYVLPGGGQNPGEDLASAVKRECLEELGISVEVIGLKFIREYIGKNHEFSDVDKDAHRVEFFFHCRIRGEQEIRGGLAPDDEQAGIEWLPLDTLENWGFYPKALAGLLKDIENRDSSFYLGDVN